MSIELHKHGTSLHDRIRVDLDDFSYRNQRRHELRVLTCFIEFDAVRDLVDMVAQNINLRAVSLMFDVSEIYRNHTPSEADRALRMMQETFHEKNIDFTWSALRAGALMHAKAYAVLQYSQGNLNDGYVWVTSGNATRRGLGQTNVMNFEVSSQSDDTEDLNKFLEIWQFLSEKYGVSIAGAVESSKGYEFSYALLCSGVFLHKWSMPMGAQLALKYNLTPNGRRKAIEVAPTLKAQGYKLDTSTLSKQPLQFASSKVLPKAFSKDYTVETLLGRWCPRSVWDIVDTTIKQDVAFRGFVERFRHCTSDEELARILEEEGKREEGLIEQGFVERDGTRLHNWKEKISGLRESEKRLSRIFLDFEDFEFPYTFESRVEVKDVYQSLTDTIEISKRKGFAVRAVQSAMEGSDLNKLVMKQNQKAKLRKMLLQ